MDWKNLNRVALRTKVRMTTQLPDDPALQGLMAIRAAGSAGAMPALDLNECRVELLLHRYHPGKRATLEARAGHRRLAVKAYAEDPAREVALCEALAAAGLAGDSGVRVAPLLAWDRDLRLLVFGWMEGPTAKQLVKAGQGARAGELAARWLKCAASLPVTLGPPFGAARRLEQMRTWVAELGAADYELGTAATELAETLTRTQPKEGPPRLVHGSLYADHVFDLGEGPGLIDWHKSGQGPAELDAGVFLATVSCLAVLHEPLAAEAARTQEAFLAATADLVDKRTVAWHQAAALLRLANKMNRRSGGDWSAQVHALLVEATRLAKAAGGSSGCEGNRTG